MNKESKPSTTEQSQEVRTNTGAEAPIRMQPTQVHKRDEERVKILCGPPAPGYRDDASMQSGWKWWLVSIVWLVVILYAVCHT